MNRLAEEKSPYLQQHAENPVDWYAWSDEAFEKAKEEDKPVFLSIGYATCHWCHVMAHESFEDEDVAELMNDAFINIKVDREERPDIDNIYMTVCQILNGQGGWPLNIIMTPEKKPFFSATYIPKENRYGRPGLKQIIPKIKELWQENRDKLYSSADEITNALQKTSSMEAGDELEESLLDKAYIELKDRFDPDLGGFGRAPKFPSPHNLVFLLRYWHRTGEEHALEMVTHTLDRMRYGGIYDHVGFGFHRYSTDAEWLLPHFEKMLYDQALIMMAYTEAWQITGKELYKQTVYEIADYVERAMTDDNGGFYSAEDADSEGEEGKFYVWSVDEIRSVLDQAEAELAIEIFNLDEAGNFKDESSGQKTGTNILHLDKSMGELAEERDMSADQLEEAWASARERLFKHREERVHPLKDDKILTDWNGLMIAALAKAGRVFDDEDLTEQARQSEAFIYDQLFTPHDHLMHRYRDGEAAIRAHADDYSFLTWGLIELYETTFEPKYLERAQQFTKTFIADFWDTENGGFYHSASDVDDLPTRTKPFNDGASPSANSVAMYNLIRLGRLTGKHNYEDKASKIGRQLSQMVNRGPSSFTQLLQALDFATGTTKEIVVNVPDNDADYGDWKQLLHQHYYPTKSVHWITPELRPDIVALAPFTEAYTLKDDEITVYVCENLSCKQPTHRIEEVREALG